MSGSLGQGEAWGSLTSLRPLLTCTPPPRPRTGAQAGTLGMLLGCPRKPRLVRVSGSTSSPLPSQLWNVAVPTWPLTPSLQPGPPVTS